MLLRSTLALLVMVVLPVVAALAETVTGTRFVVEVTSTASPGTVRVETLILGDLIRTTSIAGEDTAVAITRDGKTYLLNADLQLAQATPQRGPREGLSAKEQRYWALVDPLQVAPDNLDALFTELGAHSLGTDKIDGVEAEAVVLRIPADLQFPLDNLRLYVDPVTRQAIRLDYQRNREEQVTVRFTSIEADAVIDPAVFEVPPDYRVIEYEW